MHALDRRDVTPWAPWAVVAAGAAGIGVIVLAFTIGWDDVPDEVPALFLLIPVVAVSLVSSWRMALATALVAAVVNALLFVPPVGRVRLGYTQDVMTMLTFVAVAVIVSVAVSRRSVITTSQLIGTERMLLLRSVSHDLRNPLNTILGAATELLDDGEPDPDRAALLELVVAETRRVDRIVDNLLSLSRLQAGSFAPARRPVPVAEVVDRCLERFHRLGASGDVLKVVDPLPDVDVDVDPVQIDQVLTNLIENALRHGAPASVELLVTVEDGDGDDRDDGDVVRWTVRDDGPGFRAGRDAAQPPRLGLTVCDEIVRAHGGVLTAGNRSAGGAAVSFTVDRAR